MAPIVSVLMPVYNAERYVREAIESILAQTFGDFEFVLVDDGSTDGSTEILREYVRNDPRIVLLERERAGLTSALNRGLDSTTGEFVARMDADDISLPERLDLQVKFLRKTPEVVAVGGQAIAIDEDGDCIRELIKLVRHEEIDGRLLGRSPLARGSLIHPSVTMRRSAVFQVGKYRPEFEPAEDRDLWLRLAEIGKLANIPDLVLKYRIHNRSVSHVRSAEQHAAAMRVIRAAHHRRGLTLPERIEVWSLAERPQSEIERAKSLALSAARAGHYRTARKHAKRVLLRRPLASRAWKALMISLLGRSIAYRIGKTRRTVVGAIRRCRGIVERVRWPRRVVSN